MANAEGLQAPPTGTFDDPPKAPPSSDGPAHIHELEQQVPAKKCCAFGSTYCSGCAQPIPSGSIRYVCVGPTPCNYRMCKGCFHLGPGEGGLIQTAFSGELGGSESPAPVSSSGSSVSKSSKMQKRPSKDFPVTSGPVKTKSVKRPTSRIQAASFDFGLDLDASAEASWTTFAKQAAPAEGGGGHELHALAQQAAGHLRFLQLTVLSNSKLSSEQNSRDKCRCLELYSPFAGIPTELKTKLVEAACQVPEAARSMGAMMGMAVGDALGAPFEFLEVVDTVDHAGSHFDLDRFIPCGAYNRFQMRCGQWTDDSSMGLCLADSLLARDSYDGSDVRVRYHNWWFRGYNNAFGNDARIGSVGLGGNVASSLRAMAAGERPTPEFKAKTHDAGNGAIMRLAPIPVFYAEDVVQAAEMSAKSASATHPGPIAAAVAAFQGFVIAAAIRRGPGPASAREFLDGCVDEFQRRGCPGGSGCDELLRLLKSAEPKGGKEECWNWRAPKLEVERSLLARGRVYNGYRCSADYFGSYSVDGLAIALWSFYNTTDFASAVVRCVNFLGDADTTAAICGQIAGAFYGYEAIDSRWIKQVAKWDDGDIACRGALLYAKRAHR
mmetsp:Transcript_44654/g.126312  ORF Transcript_44654/g.126312 Transcript_44654/m.126312 type:complete len:608 (-) Transcript_44654:233-2056(-)